MDDLIFLDIQGIHQLLSTKQITSYEITTKVLENLPRIDQQIKACTSVCADSALAQAKKADEVIQSGKAGAYPF